MPESSNGEDGSEPLESLYEDGNDFDHQRLADAITGIIAIDKNSGEPIYKSGYASLDNKQKFVAQLLFQRAALALGEINRDEMGMSSPEISENLSVSKSSVTNYASELSFVESNDDYGGYIVPAYAIEDAISFLG